MDYLIEDNGNNISVGEKQLLYISRALIKKTKIILMDEATANINYITESILKKSLMKIWKSHSNYNCVLDKNY